ncbi:MAG: relaxase/mobilization nuclease domain-containing protein [Nostocaceae cyanobacterium]|nr:relaxase/mobilization nuclease domain-containing protein [Nostocaceae cyanobacterium]
MITKTKANKSFMGTTRYVLEKEKGQIIGGNMYGKTTDKLVEQFALSAHLNPQLKDPCYHLMLSLPKTDRAMSDNEITQLSERHLANVVVLSRLTGDEAQVKQPNKRIDDTKLNQLADEFIADELPAYDFFIARHSDKNHDHTHIVASRVNNLNGKSIRTWNNYAHSEHSARVLEREFNLTQVQSSWESKRKAMTRNQRDLIDKLGLPGEEIMRRAIETVVADKPTMPQLIERLWSEHEIKSIVSYYSHGGVRGIKFGIDIDSTNEDNSPTMLWKQGGNLNKYKCSFNKLQSELGVSYDPKRDDLKIKALNQILETASIKQDKQQVITTPAPTKLTDNLSLSKAKPDEAVELKRQLTLEESADLYHHYGTGLQNLLVIDQDKKIITQALQDDKSEQEATEIILNSSIGWTPDQAQELVLITKSQNLKQLERQSDPVTQELLKMAVPVAIELINRQRSNELRFKSSSLKLENNHLVYADDRRGEVFRVEVSRKPNGNLNYSPVHLGELETEDFERWDKISNLLTKILTEDKEEELSQTQRRGFSL